MQSIRETDGNFYSYNSFKTSRSHELQESKFPFVSRTEFIRSKLSNLSVHVSGVSLSGGGVKVSGRRGGWGPVSTAAAGMGAGSCRAILYSSPATNKTNHRSQRPAQPAQLPDQSV